MITERALKDINDRLENIDTKLGNHIVHIAADIATIKNDIVWIKDGCVRHREDSGMNSAQNVNLEWLKEIVKYLVFAILGAAFAIAINKFI